MSLHFEGVTKLVGSDVYIRDVTLTFERGSLNVLLGPTLSGKTSLLRLMAGLEPPTDGKITFDGNDVSGIPVQRRSVAMVYQQFINYPSLTVYENIASPLRVMGVARTEIDRRVKEAAALLGLGALLDREPLQLSGGQQQRTALARALVKRADLVLLDEPLANLDYKLREELREELPRIFSSSGAILVYATTDPAEALLLGGNTATLFEGRITQFGATAHVYHQPDDLLTAKVFSDPPLNTMQATKSGGTVTLDTGSIIRSAGVFANVPDGQFTMGFRAHQLGLEVPNGEPIPMPATVTLSEITGSESFVHLEVADHRFVSLVQGVRRLEPGTKITAYLDAFRLFLFDENGRLIANELAEAA